METLEENLVESVFEDPKPRLIIELLSKASTYDKFHFKIPMPIYEPMRQTLSLEKYRQRAEIEDEMYKMLNTSNELQNFGLLKPKS